MSLSTLSDNELVARLCKEDREAYRELYERYWYKMYATAHRKLRRKDIAEELAQELFVMIWQKRATLRVINLRAFLEVSLRNLIVDYIRRNIREEHYLEQLRQFFPVGTLTTSESVQFNELSEAIQNTLAKLPEKTREIFVLNRFEHLTIREIALRLELSEKTVEYHLSRSTTFLRQNLRDFTVVWALLLLY